MRRVLVLVAVLSVRNAEGADWRIELFGGTATSFDSRLTVRQDPLPTLEIQADWSGRSLDSPIYYSIRLSRWSERSGVSLQLVHQKLYLESPPPEIQAFSISHGYNLLTIDWGRLVHGFQLSGGAGLVIAHPESTIRERTAPESGGLGGGYHATGPTLAVSVGRWLRLGKHFRLGAEGRFSASWARVPVADDGEASVPVRSLHLLVGVGYGF